MAAVTVADIFPPPADVNLTSRKHFRFELSAGATTERTDCGLMQEDAPRLSVSHCIQALTRTDSNDNTVACSFPTTTE